MFIHIPKLTLRIILKKHWFPVDFRLYKWSIFIYIHIYSYIFMVFYGYSHPTNPQI
jgi:hypothetical protein